MTNDNEPNNPKKSLFSELPHDWAWVTIGTIALFTLVVVLKILPAGDPDMTRVTENTPRADQPTSLPPSSPATAPRQ